MSRLLGPLLRSPKLLAAVALPLVLLALLLVPLGGSATKTVTAHFPQAISIYTGSDVTIMGVKVGKVTRIIPQGDSVEVVMQYDASYKLPADVKAAIVTPTLVADRFVQFAPAYTGGPQLADHGDIPESRSVVPIEMDRIYSSLHELTEALGPNGVNRKGALNDVLDASARTLQGNGERGRQMIADLADAAETLGGNSDRLFSTVDGLADVSRTLSQNDATVQRFLTHLSQVSTQLSGESGDLQQALAAIADAVKVTEGFVRDNRTEVVSNIAGLTRTLKTVAAQKESLATTLQLAPLGLGNLADAFDTPTGSEGIRLQLGPVAMDLPNVLCDVVVNAKVPGAASVCQLIKALLPGDLVGRVGAGVTNLGVPTSLLGGKGIGDLVDEVAGMLGGTKR